MTPWGHIGGGEIELIDIQRQAFTPSLVALIEPDVGHNFHQPGAAVLLLGQLMQRPIRSQKGFLDQILGAAGISGQTHGGVMEGIQMRQDQGCKAVFARSLLSQFNIGHPALVDDVWRNFPGFGSSAAAGKSLQVFG